MVLVDAQQRRLLDRLRLAGNQPIPFAELRGGGIEFPAAVVSELELHGYAIERVFDGERLVGVRLLQAKPLDMSDSPGGVWWRWLPWTLYRRCRDGRRRRRGSN